MVLQKIEISDHVYRTQCRGVSSTKISRHIDYESNQKSIHASGLTCTVDKVFAAAFTAGIIEQLAQGVNAWNTSHERGQNLQLLHGLVSVVCGVVNLL